MRTGIQLYTLRNVAGTLPETIERVGETPFEGVQLAGLGDTSPADVNAALDRAGLDLAGAHVGLEALEDDREATLAAYDELDCSDLVIPAYEHEAFDAADSAREAGRRLSALADELADDGVRLHYHNHTFEFTDLGDETAFDAFADAADGVGLEIDTGLASHGGADPVELLERYGDRVSLVHLTDSQRGDDDKVHMDLGTGELDLQACVDACHEADVEWLVFEHGLTDDPIGSMEAAAETIADLR
jgi:sugar phosphate isomerase/epimerase